MQDRARSQILDAKVQTLFETAKENAEKVATANDFGIIVKWSIPVNCFSDFFGYSLDILLLIGNSHSVY